MERKVRGAWWGLIALFLVHGLVVASWLSRIPAIQSALRLNNGVLGVTLLGSAVGAVTTIPITGWLITRFGSKRVTAASSILFCCAVVLPGLAVSALTLAVALFVFGALAAAMDVSMNAQGVEVEEALGAPTMSRFHAMFSLGAMAGAAAGGSLAARGLAPSTHFAMSGGVNAAVVIAITPLLLSGKHKEASGEHRLPLNRIPPVLFALSAIGFCILLAEGAMADWTALYLRQILRTGPGTAALGYAVFSGAMALFRFLGDLITARLGPLLTVRAGCLVAAAGLIWALLARSAAWSMPGFALTGIGMSVIIPLVFGSGGRVPNVSPGAGIATVTGMGYIGFIVGPPTIGFVSQIVTLRYALFVVVGCCLAAAWLAGFMRLLAGSPRPAEGVSVAPV